MRSSVATQHRALLKVPRGVKVKGLNVVPSAANIAADAAHGWGTFWGSGYNWSGWQKPQIDLAVTNGANLVKVTGSGATADYPSAAVFASRVTQFITYAQSKGLLVYWNYASTDGGTGLTSQLQAVCNLVARFPNVIGIDVANEVGGASMAPISEGIARLQAARGYTRLPVTASISCGGASTFTGPTARLIAGYCDFMDYHPYFDSPAPSYVTPANSAFDYYRAQPYYKPWLIGECGSNYAGNGTDTAAQGKERTRARWNALGDLSATASDCMGVVGFSVTDYDATQLFGMYQSDLVTARPEMTIPFARWPRNP